MARLREVLRYIEGGGFTGAFTQIEIQPSGQATASFPGEGVFSGQADPETLDRMASLVNDRFESLARAIPPPQGWSEYTYRLEFGNLHINWFPRDPRTLPKMIHQIVGLIHGAVAPLRRRLTGDVIVGQYVGIAGATIGWRISPGGLAFRYGDETGNLNLGLRVGPENMRRLTELMARWRDMYELFDRAELLHEHDSGARLRALMSVPDLGSWILGYDGQIMSWTPLDEEVPGAINEYWSQVAIVARPRFPEGDPR